MKNGIFKIVPAQSRIEWIGRKVTGAHNGTITITQGEIVLNEGKLAGGKFIADTQSITIADIADPATNAQMAGHLASDDFFSSQKHPEATLEITHVNGNDVDANLTIRGITHPVHFAVAVQESASVVTASATLLVDRTKYEMKFRSGNFFLNLGDTLIYNDFELNVRLTANLVNSDELISA